MKKRTIFRITIPIVILAGSFILLRSSGKSQNSGCKESMETCCKKRNNNPAPGDMIWETLSREFFSFAGSSN